MKRMVDEKEINEIKTDVDNLNRLLFTSDDYSIEIENETIAILIKKLNIFPFKFEIMGEFDNNSRSINFIYNPANNSWVVDDPASLVDAYQISQEEGDEYSMISITTTATTIENVTFILHYAMSCYGPFSYEV